MPWNSLNSRQLMERTRGSSEIKIGLIDGPVAIQHTDFASNRLREIPGKNVMTCAQANSAACRHGTFIAGILTAKQIRFAPAICPDCTLLIRPIFTEIIFRGGNAYPAQRRGNLRRQSSTVSKATPG